MENLEEQVLISRSCTWWNLREHAKKTEDEQLVCPVCKAPLYDAGTLDEWFKNVDEYAVETHDRNFPDYIEWVQNQCYTDAKEAREIWEGIRLS